MRIRLLKGKQKELILEAKGKKTWSQLSSQLQTHANYLSSDLKNQRVLLSERLYFDLCILAKKKFDEFIIEKLEDNWGRSKGGKNSPGSIVNIKIPLHNEMLAELIGAILGDGNISCYKRGSSIGVYQVKVAGDYNLDKDYHVNYLKKIIAELFDIKCTEILVPQGGARYLLASSKKLLDFLLLQGLKAGDKIKNQSTIPNWIFENKSYLKACVRGLIDTDGSIFRMSTKDPNLLRIGFTNHNFTLLNDARKAFSQLGFHPSKIICNRHFVLSRKEDITKYLKEIGFSNKKHLDRYDLFVKSPVE